MTRTVLEAARSEMTVCRMIVSESGQLGGVVL